MPYKTINEYMSWEECLRRCPKGAIKRNGSHYWLDEKLCDRCRNLPEYCCGGIFENNSPNYLQDFNSYWQEWFTNYNKLLERLRQTQGGQL